MSDRAAVTLFDALLGLAIMSLAAVLLARSTLGGADRDAAETLDDLQRAERVARLVSLVTVPIVEYQDAAGATHRLQGESVGTLFEVLAREVPCACRGLTSAIERQLDALTRPGLRAQIEVRSGTEVARLVPDGETPADRSAFDLRLPTGPAKLYVWSGS